MGNIFLKRACRHTVSVILLAAVSCSMLSSVITIDRVQLSDAEESIVTLDVCHVGDASFSVNAESPLFMEFPPPTPFIAVKSIEYHTRTVVALFHALSPIEHPPKSL